MARLLIASPHRYPDLARLWHRFAMRDLVPAFERLHLAVAVNIFCDAHAEQFLPHLFPGATLTSAGPGARDFMEFYDAALQAPCDFLLFIDADTFLLDAAWVGSYFETLSDPKVAAVSYVPRRKEPAIFALLCRAESYRALPAPALACRYEFPEDWPGGVNLQPGDFAARELKKRGSIVVNIPADESSRHTVNFRSTTGLRASREHTTQAAGEQVFLRSVTVEPAYLIAAYDNLLVGCLYEALYHEPFAADSRGRPLGGSLTLAEMRHALRAIRDAEVLALLRERFGQSHANILRMAAREGVQLSIPSVLSDEQASAVSG